MAEQRPSDTPWPRSRAWFAYLREDGSRRLGLVSPQGELRDWCALDPRGFDEQDMLARGALDAAALDLAWERAEPLEQKIDELRFDIPVRRPSKILCLGKNFAAHAAEFGAEVPKEPLFFTKLVDTLLPHRGTIRLPHWVDTRIDHEIELAVVLGFPDPEGSGRRNVPRATAMDVVAGYTVLNDVTARRMQGDDRGAQKPWLRCKSFDTFCPIGPWIVPASALDPHDLAIDLWVGDEHRQSSHTGKMVVDIPQAIEWLSRHTTLRPGDLVAMGTPEGVGPLRDGDLCTGRVEGIGTLTNPVRRETAP